MSPGVAAMGSAGNGEATSQPPPRPGPCGWGPPACPENEVFGGPCPWSRVGAGGWERGRAAWAPPAAVPSPQPPPSFLSPAPGPSSRPHCELRRLSRPQPSPGHLPSSRVTQEGGEAPGSASASSPITSRLPARLPHLFCGTGMACAFLRPAEHTDLNPASTQERPGLCKGVAGWPWPGAPCQRSSRHSAWLHTPSEGHHSASLMSPDSHFLYLFFKNIFN